MTPPERIDYLELLHRVCCRKGWKLLLRASERRELGIAPRAELSFLDVTDRGSVLARVGLSDLVGPHDAAELLVDMLGRRGLLRMGRTA